MRIPQHIRLAMQKDPSPYVAQRIDLIADATLRALQSGTVVTNKAAAGAVVVTLPSDPQAGCEFRFIVRTAQSLMIRPPSGGAIIIAGAKQTDGKGISADDEAECVTLTYDGENDWLASNVGGTWTVET